MAYDRQTPSQPAAATLDSLHRMVGSVAILNPLLSRGCASVRRAIAERL